MQTVSQEWKAAHRQRLVPLSYIEISYTVTDPEAVADAAASDNGHMSLSNVGQTIDGSDKSFARYSTLEHNGWLLSGDIPLYMPAKIQDTGFVSSVLSGDGAAFSSVPVITIGFTKPHDNIIPGVTIQWSETFGEWASSFNIVAYNGETVVASKSVTDNTDITTFVEFDIAGYDKIEISVLEWSLPRARARIESITLGAIKVFGGSSLLGYDHSQTASLLSLQLPKAAVAFTISNVEGEWNPDNPQGVYKYLLERQEIVVRYGYKLGDSVEWIKAGTFYLSEWDTPQNGISAQFTARDVLEFMSNPFVVSKGSYTLLELATMAFEQSNLPALKNGGNRWLLDEALGSITVSVPTDGDGAVAFSYTCAEVVQLCANAACCVMYQDRNGVFHVKPLAQVLSDYLIDPFISYDHPEYSFSKVLKSVDVNSGMGSAAANAAGEVQQINNPLIQDAAVANTVAEWVKEVLKNRKTVSNTFRADPRLDALDSISVESKYATNAVIVTDISYYTTGGAIKGKYSGLVVG